MDDKNIIEFTVEGVGTFKAYKEVPAANFMQQMKRRNEVAKLFGGLTELNKMEAVASELMKSTDKGSVDAAQSMYYEMGRARFYAQTDLLIIDKPKGFAFETCDPETFDKVWLAWETARGTFRTADKQEPSANDVSAGSDARKTDTKS